MSCLKKACKLRLDHRRVDTIIQADRQAGLYPQPSNSTLRQKLSIHCSMWGAESLSRRTPGRKPPNSTQLVILLGVKMLHMRIRAQNHRIFILIDQQERVQVVGYSGHICELQIYLLSFTNKFKPQVINHKCIPENLFTALLLSEKQKRYA
jgi:hypothetical protein